jgi:hypothetical protein
MSKNKPLLLGALAGMLGLVTAMSFAVGAGSTGSEMTVPRANMNMAANWKGAPVTGPASTARVPWANLKVNPDSTIEAQNEPWVAINPNNRNHIVVGANSWQVGNGRYEVFAYVTFDGGQTWAQSQPYIDRNGGRLNAADPTLAFGPNGELYFAFVALNPAAGAVAVSTSYDGGLTWASQSWATPFSTAADKPALGIANGMLHVFYQNNALYGVSSTNGMSWSAATMIEAGGKNAAPLADNKGNLYVFYNTTGHIKMASLLAGNDLGFQVSTVAATTALQARPTHYRASIYPTAGIDAAGNLHVAWADGRNAGRGNDILLSSLRNGSWSAPVVVNTDAGSADQLMPALTVASDGSVAVAFLDNRNDPANVNYDVYMARVSNGSVQSNVRVTNQSSNPYNDPRTQGTMIGDYFAAAAAGNTVYVLWADSRNMNQDIYMAPVTMLSSKN